MITIVRQIYTYFAPLLWFCTGFIACHVKQICHQKFDPITDGIISQDKWTQPKKNTRRKLKSAFDHQLHPAYPLRLRNENKYVTRKSTPTIQARRALDFTNKCLSYNCHCTENRSPNTLQDKRNYKEKGNKFFHKKHSPRSTKHNKYSPTGVSTNKDISNLNYTTKQYLHLRKTAQQVLVAGAKFGEDTMQLAQNIATLSPSTFRAATDSDEYSRSFPVIWDTGASVCVSPDKRDFITYQESPDINEVKGLGGKRSTVIGQGMISWAVHDVNGTLHELRLKAYHVPTCKSRLLSTNVLLNTYKGEHLTVDSTTMNLSGIKNDPDRYPVLVFYNTSTKLPTTSTYRMADIKAPTIAMCHNISTVHSKNNNLSHSEKELLRWHQRLGHLAFKKIQHLMHTGVLSHTDSTRHLHTAASKIVHPPKCAACLFGKQTVRPSPGRTTTVIKDRAEILRAGNLLPGAQEVSVDHFISSVKGRLFQGYDKGGMTPDMLEVASL